MEYENSLAYLWGENYTVHRIDSIQNYQTVNSQYFADIFVLSSILTHFGQDTTSFTDSFLDTLYKDFWNSHGTICASPNIGFIDANSTKWDELAGVASNPFPHKSFTIMIPLSGAGNEIVYHLINKSNPPVH